MNFQSKANFLKVILFLATASILTCLYFSYSNSTSLKAYNLKPIQQNSRSTRSNLKASSSPEKGVEQSFKFRILYLTQTEKCLPGFLRSPEVLGDTGACQCDVLVLSYKEECKDTSLPHVKYIYKPSTTWTAGRNTLYETAKQKTELSYLYYIFMDDDINLKLLVDTNSNPWRTFEASLRTAQPPVADIDVYREYKDLKQPNNCTPDRITKFAEIGGFDAAFNAFHTQAIDHVLPYTTKYDNESWWYSQIYLVIRCDIKFHGSVVGDTRIKAINNQHRSYPKEDNGKLMNKLKIIAQEIENNEIPDEYRTILEPILQQWIERVDWREPGSLYCNKVIDPNAVQRFVPYHF